MRAHTNFSDNQRLEICITNQTSSDLMPDFRIKVDNIPIAQYQKLLLLFQINTIYYYYKCINLYLLIVNKIFFVS